MELTQNTVQAQTYLLFSETPLKPIAKPCSLSHVPIPTLNML